MTLSGARAARRPDRPIRSKSVCRRGRATKWMAVSAWRVSLRVTTLQRGVTAFHWSVTITAWRYGVSACVTALPAKVGDKLTTRDFGTGTRGFSASEDMNVAVCVLPGTELSFTDEVTHAQLWPWQKKAGINHKTAIFRQINQHAPGRHHDALEFPDGQIVLLHFLTEGQKATVLQLPAAAVGSKAPQRAAYV